MQLRLFIAPPSPKTRGGDGGEGFDRDTAALVTPSADIKRPFKHIGPGKNTFNPGGVRRDHNGAPDIPSKDDFSARPHWRSREIDFTFVSPLDTFR